MNTRRENISLTEPWLNDTDGDSSSEKRGSPWSKVLLSEFILIVIINAFTLVAFARNRHLRKRTTYLIINLTVADLLVGAVSGPVEIFGRDLNRGHGFSWQEFIILTLSLKFPLASQANLSLISLERLHATLFPFRHCLIDKWFYFKVIISSWMITLLLSSTMSVLGALDLVLVEYALSCYTVLTLLLITVSNVIIAKKVKSNPPPQHFSAVASERKLSVTLNIITGVSMLTILPSSLWMAVEHYMLNQMFHKASPHLDPAVALLYYANSIVNPLIYAIRMQEFRKAVKELCCKRTAEMRRVQPIELHAM